MGKPLDHDELFYYQQPSNTNPIYVTAFENYPYVMFNPPIGIDLSVLRLIAARYNRSIDVNLVFCQPSQSNTDCISRKASNNNNSIIRLDRTVYQNSTAGYVAALTPTTLVLMVPCSGSISVVELLFKPFEKSLFYLIACISIGSAILMRRLPKLFRNNLILLPWCSFESYNLHRTGRLERFTMIGLVLLTFFIRNVFENKLVAVLSSWPLQAEVNDFQALLDAGWKVKTAMRLETKALQEDPRWKNAIQYDYFQIVGFRKHAYLTMDRLYECFSTLWRAMKLRFAIEILPEQFNLGYGMYYFGLMDDFADAFESMQRRVRTIYLLHPIAKSVETIHALTPVEDLFPEDDLRDLGGHEVHFVIKENSRQVRLDGHGFIGTLAHWFRSTVRHLNGTFQIRRATCPKGQNPSECRWRLVQECIENSRIMVNPFYSDRTSPDLLISVLSSGVVVLAPNGRILSDLEVFLEPYDFEVWLTLLVVLGSCLIAQRLFFNTLESSLVLITVCGFERGEFHRTKGPMTICFAALTFYAFFMLESYSARIISLMTEKPLTDVPREIADFARFAIRLKTQSEVHAGSLAVTNRSGIYGQLDYDKTWKFQPCEMQYGIILSDVIAKLYVQREEFCDRKEFGHHILGESLGLMVDLYVFGRWNPLKLAFLRSQRRLFEAGFFGLWAAQFERSYVNYWRTRVAIPGEGDEVTMLDLSDLGVPFLVLGMGGSLALIAFVFEFIAGLSFWKRLNLKRQVAT
ncbi:hypothetical protein quinque_012300 [Culex quinquefasciatus]